jgi:hypothetical protein
MELMVGDITDLKWCPPSMYVLFPLATHFKVEFLDPLPAPWNLEKKRGTEYLHDVATMCDKFLGSPAGARIFFRPTYSPL